MIAAAPPLVRFVCPNCRGELRSAPDAHHCDSCGIRFPVIAGIPDFRVAPDPWIGIEADREKALRLEELTRGLNFEASVRTYWEMTPTTPRRQAHRFIEHVLRAPARSREWLAALEQEEQAPAPGPWLDLGCGTADLLAAAPGRTIVGCDIALRWLVIARKRVELAGAEAPLVCCCAERLPFPDGSFERVLSLGLLEHVADAVRVAAEARRVLRRGGTLRLRTLNRHSLLSEPHVGVWGVGYLPRRWADAYVRWRSGQRYLNHRPLSRGELRRTLRGAGLRRVEAGAARLLPAETVQLGRWAPRLAPAYETLRRTPLLRDALAWVAPLLEGAGVRE